jgi:hypothetical protein
MTRLPDRFVEDRALRESARKVLSQDIENLRGALAQQGLASRVSTDVSTTITSRIRAGARDVLDEARTLARERKGLLAVLIAAIALFVARGTILDWVENLLEGDLAEDDDKPGEAAPPEAASEGDLP